MTDDHTAAPKYLGKTVNDPVDNVDTVPWNKGPVSITLHCSEFTSHCPVTGQPDFGRVVIRYTPRDRIIETKSLKMYLWKFREAHEFNEALVRRICDEVAAVVHPVSLEVTGVFNPRGGINVECKASMFDTVECKALMFDTEEVIP